MTAGAVGELITQITAGGEVSTDIDSISPARLGA